MAKTSITSVKIDNTDYNLMIINDLSVIPYFSVGGYFTYQAPYYEEWNCIHNTNFAPIKSDTSSSTCYNTDLKFARFFRYISGSYHGIGWSNDDKTDYYSGDLIQYNGSGTQVYYSFIIDDETEEAWIINHEYQNNAYVQRGIAYSKDGSLYEAISKVSPTPQGDATCKVNYYLQENDYEYSKLTFKEDTPPIDMNDGYVEDIDASQSFINIENLVEGQKYYFTIFTDKSESEPFPYIVGPVITDWVNAELPSPMVTALSTKPYKYENQEAISSGISNDDMERLGYNLSDGTKDLYNNIIPTRSSSRAFWIFGNNQRGLYVYYQNVSGQAYIYMKAYYKGTVLFDERLEWLASARSARQGRVYVGKNDITKKGSIFFISYPTNWTTTNAASLKTLLKNDSTTYYFITNRPNPANYEWYINQINGTGFTWGDLERNSGSGYTKYPFSDYSQWRSDNGSTGDFNIKSNGDAYVFQTEKSRIDIVSTDYVTYSAILNPTHPFEGEYYDSFSTYNYYTVGRCRYNNRYQYVIQGMTNEVNGYPYTATGTLEEVLDAIRVRCKNVSIYVNGDCWSEV